MLETTGDNSEKIKIIMINNGWDSINKSFSPLSFKILREKVIPQLFALYSRENNNIDTCFNIENNCNSYIHSSVNNYDLHQLNTRPKRIYKHILPTVYPNVLFKDIDKEMIEKLFNKYRTNKSGDIIYNYNDISYLNYYLLQSSILNSDIELLEDKEIIKNDENFHKILEKERIDKSLEYNPIIKKINKYDQDDYKNISILSNTDNRFLKNLLTKQIVLNDEKQKIKLELIKKLPNLLSEPSKPPVPYDILTSIHIQIIEEYISKVTDNKDIKLFDDYFQQIFSEYIKNNNYNISLLSDFIYENDNITSNQKKDLNQYLVKIVKLNLIKKIYKIF